ncbi:RICIN domain-containing protein [Streptomyces sp. NPDC001691]|uniref:RICIN domain-containing protein n=1 Tax=unclassified Streptomyces TaxID=2593676 RepID=UPI000DEADFAD|nr:ricin-type beta-trefoil lectin domain protein [Streptomyces sp. SDr-06]RCH67632.1 hypothetical protein DT019_15290 [Streptomyces sp. SDr-06]
MFIHKKLAAALATTAAAMAVGALAPGTVQAAEPTVHQLNWSKGQTVAAPDSVHMAQGITGAPAATGVYARIYSLFRTTPNQCLDADATAGGNGTRVQAWGCNGSTQQEWIVWTNGSIESVRFRGMCLDADLNGGGANGTRVQLWQCNGSTQQQWYHPSGDLAIYNVRFNNNDNTVLDRDATNTGNGARAQLWAKNFQSQQWWDIRTA